jgi:hypothetical protein
MLTQFERRNEYDKEKEALEINITKKRERGRKYSKQSIEVNVHNEIFSIYIYSFYTYDEMGQKYIYKYI